MLMQEYAKSHQVTLACRRSIQLNGQLIELIFTDEQAKTNAVMLLRLMGKEDARIVLRQLLSGTGMAARVRLRPNTGPGTTQPLPTAISGQAALRGAWQLPLSKIVGNGQRYGAVFDALTPKELIEPKYGSLSVC